MALTDNSPTYGLVPGNRARADDPPAPPSLPLQRLARLHDEARQTFQATRLLERAPQAALIVMVSAAAVLAADWGSLRADFAWSLLLLVGIVGMVRTYIRGFARSLRRVPLEEAAADLRLVLLFCGLVWGSGVFLVLPPAPSTVLAAAFALAPALALALALQDRRGAVCFTVPAAVTAAGAAQAQFWPQANLTTFALLSLATAIVLLAGPRRA
jgi:hypothetical protein